ncbi:fam-a protein [Plasmodium chabaudi chabaudi]|uniref:Fam-a protein n=1 Tax=Plasmodium chabaudi chabaudi TaxID=31271 RepID=A0A1D3L6W8_PLACU|nr:fam-a protein [Plasmodium chabaudi chabaudi]
MNNGYVKKFFFVFILFGCLNNKVLTTEYTEDNAASYEPTRPKAIRIKITLSKTIPCQKEISETSSSETIRPKRLRSNRGRSKATTYGSSSSKIALSRTPRYKTPPFEAGAFKANPFEAGPSKVPSFEAQSSEVTPFEAGPSKVPSFEARLLEVPPFEAGPSKVPSFEAGPSKVTPFEAGPSKVPSFEIVLPRAVLTNPPSPHITYIPVSYKLDKIYKKNKHLLCKNPSETQKATTSMDEAVNLLKYYATTNNGFKYYSTTTSGVNIYYRNNGNGSSIERCQFQISNPDKYDDIINTLWDPNGPRKFDPSFINGKVARSYDRNLLMVLRFYKNDMLFSERYFYALAKKVHISEDTTIIVMSSGNVNDHNPSGPKIYANKVVGSMNTFKTSVDFDDDVMSGNYKRSFVNLSGFLIKKTDDHVDVTFVNSMEFNAMIPIKMLTRDADMEAVLNVISMQRYFNRQ